MTRHISRRAFTSGTTALAAGLATRSSGANAQAATSNMTYVGWSHTEAGSKPFLDGLFDGFKSKNSAVKFETIGVPFAQVETTLQLRKRSGQRTDVAQMQERWLTLFASGGGLFDVDAALGPKFATDTYHESALAMTMVGGKRYGLPWVTGSTGLVANMKTLEDAGVKAVPETIDEWLAALRAVKKAKPTSSPMGVTTKNTSLLQLESQLFFWQFGARFFGPNGEVTVDSTASRQALGLMADMVKEGLILPGNDRFDFRRLFAQELVAFYPDPPLARAFARAQSGKGEAYDANVRPVAMPVLKKGDAPVSVQWGHLVSFFDHGGAKLTPESPAAAFVRHISDTDNQIAYYKAAGVFPSTKAAQAALKDDRYLVDWINLTRSAQPDEVSVFSNAGELRQIIGEEIAGAMLGQKTADAAITSMSTRLKSAGPKK